MLAGGTAESDADSAITIPSTSRRSLHPSASAQLKRVGKETGISPGPRCSRRSVGGRQGTHPRPQPQLHPQQTYCKVWLQSGGGAVGGAGPRCSARQAAGARCAGSRTGPARPHGASGRPAPPRPARPAPPQRPAVRIPPPAATPASAGSRFASAGSRFSSAETPRLRARSPRPPRPGAEAPAPGGYPDRRRTWRQASAFEELAGWGGIA